MPYLYATEDLDYSDFSSGRVIYNLPSAPAFPVRLASEVFQRARAAHGLDRRLALYDPTCGAAYHLCALGFLHQDAIASITASDLDENALTTARRNLGLLSKAGLDQRELELKKLLDMYGKPSHTAALQSLRVLRERLLSAGGTIHTRVFQANALDRHSMQAGLAGQDIDLVFSDIPYGQLSRWSSEDKIPSGQADPLWTMLDSLLPVLSAHTLIAIAGDKSQKPRHPAYRRITQFQLGKRLVTLLGVDG